MTRFVLLALAMIIGALLLSGGGIVSIFSDGIATRDDLSELNFGLR